LKKLKTISRKIHIGTSGWHYDHWEGPFYPKNVSKDGYLEYYADHFHSVEIKNSFYQLPKKETQEIFCYFDNDEAGYAVQNARKLQGMLKHRYG
jgi:uncharacterized protein YecE (DUF72 family)